jgi:hypothetical protein
VVSQLYCESFHFILSVFSSDWCNIGWMKGYSERSSFIQFLLETWTWFL